MSATHINQNEIGTAADSRDTAVVLGADSFIGSRMTEALTARGQGVLAFGESKVFQQLPNGDYDMTDYRQFHIPQDTRWILFCHDVAKDREQHLQALATLCEYLGAFCAQHHQVRLVYVASSNSCCSAKGCIKENARLCPHNLLELAICQAEQLIGAWSCMTRGGIIPVLFRHGELYGETEDWSTPAGYVNECLARARQGKTIRFFGNLNQRRTLTHVKDLAEAVCAVLLQDGVSGTFNIPGDSLTAFACFEAISRQYGVEFELSDAPILSDNLLPWAEDRVLDTRGFKETVPDFTPSRCFKKWLRTQGR